MTRYLKFVPYHLLDGRPSVGLDGSPAPGTVLTVTHWPGYPPPVGIEDDLSAQMTFRLLGRPDLVPDEAEAVSNNHFDQDGLVSLYALVAPDDAVQRRRFLEDVAFAGDFALCRDRDAARVSMVLSALADGDGLPADYTERTRTSSTRTSSAGCPSCATTSGGTATSGATRTPRSTPAMPPLRTAGP
jgi:hypothetical protein